MMPFVCSSEVFSEPSVHPLVRLAVRWVSLSIFTNRLWIPFKNCYY